MSRVLRAAVLAVAAVLASLLAARPAEAGPGAGDGCGVCHGDKRVEHETSIHASAAIGCTTCHGGDAGAVSSKDAAHDRAKGFRGRISRVEVADACGTCHADIVRMRPFGLRTDALAAWRTSHHGKAMTDKGLIDAATCTDCHGSHGVRRVKDALSPAFRVNVPTTCARCHGDAALMQRHGIETHAVSDFSQSVHGVRLARGEPGVPSCADCHDAHAATPPGATEVADVCGSCHREMRDRFNESPHAAASRRGAMRQCITCHGNHAVGKPGHALFDTPGGEGGDERTGVHCLSCHDATKSDDRGAAAAKAFGSGLRLAGVELRNAGTQVDFLESEGFHVGDERETLDRAARELVRIVPLTHTVDVPRVDGALRRVRSLIDEALEGCGKKIRESRDRRIFGTAAGVLLLLAAGCLILIRRRMHA